MKTGNKTYRLQLILSAILSLTAIESRSQNNYFFENLTVSNGLSNSIVTCTFQDHLGYLWIGTVDGLNRYDGYDIKVFKNIPNDSTSLPSNLVSSIGEDQDGQLYIGTLDFVNVFNRANDNFKHIPLEKGPQINETLPKRILCDSKNNIWVATDQVGIQRLDKANNRFNGINYNDYTGKPVSFSTSGRILNINELKNGNIIVTDYELGIFLYNAEKNELQPFFANAKQNLKGRRFAFEDSEGKIWFSGASDIYIYDPSLFDVRSLNMPDKFIGAQFRNSLGINIGRYKYGTISEDSYNHIYVLSDLGILETVDRGNNFSVITESIPSIVPSNLYKDHFGIYWISTVGQGAFMFDPAKKPFRFYEIALDNAAGSKILPVTDIIQNPIKKNELILSNVSNGIFLLDRDSGKSHKLQDVGTLSNDHELLIDDKNTLWYTDNYHLKRMDLTTKKIESYPFPNTTFFRGIYGVNQIKIGPDKNIWVANVNGIAIFNPLTKKFSMISTITNKSFNQELLEKIRSHVKKNQPIASLLKVEEGARLSKDFSLNKSTKILVVNLGEGRQTGTKVTTFDFGWVEDSTGKKLWGADKLENTFYAGGGYKNRYAFGVLELPKGNYHLKYISDIGHSYNHFNVPASPDSMWYGIQVLEIDDPLFSEINLKLETEYDNSHFPPLEIANDLEFSKKYSNTVWITGNGIGLLKYNLTSQTYKWYLFDDKTELFPLINSANQVIEDKDGLIWLATNVGLIRFDPESEKFQIITQRDGLTSNLIAFVKEDFSGNLWIGTPGGISMLSKKSKTGELNFINYDNMDGLHDLPLNGSIISTTDGELLYGGFGGVNAFYPGSSNNTLSQPVITNMTVSGTSIEKIANDIDLEKSISEASQIELSYSNNNLSFEFASIHFSRPQKNKLAFMLEGIDKKWNYTNRRFASYLNLAPGEYVFKLKGSNGDGIWNPAETSLKILITPPWWKTYYAYAGYFLILIGLFFAFDKFQKRRILAKSKVEMTLKEAELRAVAAESQAKIIQLENDRKSQELNDARNLQMSMLPKNVPQFPHLDIAVYMKTATEVGGDYYDFNVSLDGTLTVVLGDATGHGMKAGNMVISAKSLFNSYAANPDIIFTFQEMTRCIKQMQFQSMAMCMTMLKIQNNKLVMSAAGMPPVYIYRNEQSKIDEFQFEGMPLGTMENFPYQLKQTELFKGDTLLVMSDGFPELVNDKDITYGYKRARNSFEEVAEKEPEEIITYLKEAGSRWVNDKDPDDDVTFVVIKIK